MSLTDNIKEQISIEVIKTLYSRFENFPENSDKNRNAPFHKAFLNAFSDKFNGKVTDIPFFISLSSWLHGLNTTLGQSFFEVIAHILSDGQKKSFTRKGNNLLKITRKQKENVSEIITDLKNGNEKPKLKRENDLIFINQGAEIEANSFTADVFIEDDDIITCIELKSVKPNAGEMRGEKQKILEAKSALYHSFPNKKVEFFIGFPFDPTSNESTSANKDKFLHSIIDGTKYYDYDEVLLSNELWDFLSADENTMDQLLDIINSIAKPDFKEKYNKMISPNLKRKDKIQVLTSWNLHTEVDLMRNNNLIQKSIQENKRLKRIYNQSIFIDGKYNHRRKEALKGLL